MTLTKTHKIIISIIVVAVLVGVYVLFDRKARLAQEQFKTSDVITPFSTTTSGGIQIVGNNGQYTIEEVPVTEGRSIPQPIPDLARPVPVHVSDLSPEVLATVTTKIQGLQATLKTDPMKIAEWLNLGIYQKMVRDYEGAKLSWQYATRLAPNDFIAYGNLGDLYGYFLKDNAMAEMYFKKALEKGPTQAYLYIQLATLYKDVFKDMDKARAIIATGLTKIPGDQSLLQLQASFK